MRPFVRMFDHLLCVAGSWLYDGRDVLRVAAELGGNRQGDPAAAVPPSTYRSARLLAELYRRYSIFTPCSQQIHRRFGRYRRSKQRKSLDILKTSGQYAAATTNPNRNTKLYFSQTALFATGNKLRANSVSSPAYYSFIDSERMKG